MLPLILGFLASGLVGYWCIGVLMRLLRQQRLIGFAVYCAGFGMLSLPAALFS
jgi:undecaprenyl pyrophosphate phosphatase UppP